MALLDSAIAGGVSGLLSGASSLLGSAVSSGGTSAAQQLDMLEKYYQPTKAGWSWAQMENQVALDQYRRQLDSSAKADLELSKQMNEQLPSSQVSGLRRAGLNPILAVMGSGFSPIQSSASASMSGGAHVPSGLSKPSRRVNSAGSAMDFYKMITGVVQADKENREADTAVKDAQVGNVKAQNEVLRAEAYKKEQEAERIKDQIDHGDTLWSDYGREARSGIGKPLQEFTEWFLHKIGFGSPDAAPPGSSAKQPGVIIDLTPGGYENTKKKYQKILPSLNDYIRNKQGE